MSALVPDEIPDQSGDQSGDDSDSDEYDQAVGVNPDPVDPSEVSGPTEVERTDTDDEESITKRFGTVTQSDIAEEAMEFAEAVQLGTRQAVVSELSSRIDDLPLLSVGMLRHYREETESEPVSAHIAAGGDDDHQLAYSRNRPLRQSQLIRHVGEGRYAYAIPDLIREAYADQLSESELSTMVQAVEASFIDSVSEPSIDDWTDPGR